MSILICYTSATDVELIFICIFKNMKMSSTFIITLVLINVYRLWLYEILFFCCKLKHLKNIFVKIYTYYFFYFKFIILSLKFCVLFSQILHKILIFIY